MVGNTLNYDGKISLEDYRKNSPQNAHQERRIRLINGLLDKIPSIGSGLDYGCGLGDLTFRISPRFDEIVGVDVTPERVEWANNEFAPIKFYCCEENNLDFPDGSFNTVLSSVVINWVDDPELYLKNIHRVLKEDGHLLLVVKAPERTRAFFRSLLGKPAKDDADFRLATMKETLARLGFQTIAIDAYYDPIADEMTNFKNILIQLVNFPMRVLNSVSHASYYGVLARKHG